MVWGHHTAWGHTVAEPLPRLYPTVLKLHSQDALLKKWLLSCNEAHLPIICFTKHLQTRRGKFFFWESQIMGGSMPKNTVFCKSAENWRGHRLSISVVQIIAYENKSKSKAHLYCSLFPRRAKKMIVSLKSKGYRWLTISPRALFDNAESKLFCQQLGKDKVLWREKKTLDFKIEKKPCLFADDLQPHTWLFLSGIEVCVATPKTSEYLRIVILSRLHLLAPSRRRRHGGKAVSTAA